MNESSKKPKPENEDLQIVVDGFLRHAPKADVIEFSIYFLRFELRCTVTIPEEGSFRAPVYIRHRLAEKRRFP